jgi:UDP-N-acetylglucosamine 2-epimerase (non-hydrolysing)
MTTTVHLVASARPNFMKIAPLWRALSQADWCLPVFVHAGQHYDAVMSDIFLSELGLPTPQPHFFLGAGSGSHGAQTARVLAAYEALCLTDRPDWTVVVGDVNATLAAALAAKKLGIRVAHLEAGLRSGDRSMPEELNRIVTDAIVDLLWTPSPDGDANLLREGAPADRIDRVGNIMIDSFEAQRVAIAGAAGPEAFGLTTGGYGVVTLHRPANVDAPETLSQIVEALCAVAATLPLVFPVHPRTKKTLVEASLSERLTRAGVILTDPLGYVAFMALVTQARLAITDSGGVQEETSYVGVPCLTLRDTTERPITVTHGTNRLVDLGGLPAAITAVLAAPPPETASIPLWDGHTAERCVKSLKRNLHRPAR